MRAIVRIVESVLKLGGGGVELCLPAHLCRGQNSDRAVLAASPTRTSSTLIIRTATITFHHYHHRRRRRLRHVAPRQRLRPCFFHTFPLFVPLSDFSLSTQITFRLFHTPSFLPLLLSSNFVRRPSPLSAFLSAFLPLSLSRSVYRLSFLLSLLRFVSFRFLSFPFLFLFPSFPVSPLLSFPLCTLFPSLVSSSSFVSLFLFSVSLSLHRTRTRLLCPYYLSYLSPLSPHLTVPRPLSPLIHPHPCLRSYLHPSTIRPSAVVVLSSIPISSRLVLSVL